MDHKEQLPDENKEYQYGALLIKVRLADHAWLTGRFDLDALVETLLLMVTYGLANFNANPEAFLERSKPPLYRRRRELKKIAQGLDQKAIEEFLQQVASEEKTEEAPREFVDYINFLVTYIANNLTNGLNQTLTSLIHEGMLAFQIMDQDTQQPFQTDSDDTIAYLLNEYKQAIKKRLGLTRRQRKARYDLSELLNHYSTVLPLWQDAKEIYKDNRKRNWQQIVKTVHPYLPVDLVARLSGNPSDLSDEVKENLAEKGGTSEPSDIAIEHAARLCGAPDYSYALSTLEGKKTELNRATKEL